jgi:hypothetical protein
MSRKTKTIHKPGVLPSTFCHRERQPFRAKVITYADASVIFSREHAAEALDWTPFRSFGL